MSIVYARFDVAVHNLNFSTLEELEAYKTQIQKLLLDNHPGGKRIMLEGDVEVDIDEHAGNPDIDQLES